MLRGEVRKKKEFKSGLKRASKQAYALNLNGSDCPTVRIGQTEQCRSDQCWNRLNGPDCPTHPKMRGSDKRRIIQSLARVCTLDPTVRHLGSDKINSDIPAQMEQDHTWTGLSDPLDRTNFTVTSNLKWRSELTWTGLSDHIQHQWSDKLWQMTSATTASWEFETVWGPDCPSRGSDCPTLATFWQPSFPTAISPWRLYILHPQLHFGVLETSAISYTSRTN